MLSKFYSRYSRPLLLLMVVSFPYLYWKAHSERSNNNVETWLPEETLVRQNYEQFKKDFGIEEVVLLGLQTATVDEPLIEALAARFESLDGVRECLTATRVTERMKELGVEGAEAEQRVTGLLRSDQGNLTGIVMLLSPDGAAQRGETVAEIRETLDYCLLERPEIALTGSPVLVTELDRLGAPESTTKFFGMSLIICLMLLKYAIGDWKLCLSLLGVTVWTICCTKAMVLICGGEMNFIMGALSIMVMIFTLTIAIHVVDYYTEARDSGAADPLRVAIRESIKPTFLSTLTTLIGLLSLNVSNILPVRQFAYAAALGAVIATIVGLGVTPALISMWPDRTASKDRRFINFSRWGSWVGLRRWRLLGTTLLLVVGAGFGLMRLAPHINPVDFLPKDNPVAADLRTVDEQLTSIGSVEAIVDFGLTDRPFVDRMLEVRRIQEKIDSHPVVRHSFSAASMFPGQLPGSPLAAARLFDRASNLGGTNNYIAQDERLWRISVRVSSGWKSNEAYDALQELLAEEPVILTGVSPLIADAQEEIFTSYWKSLTVALTSISVIMILSLRSLTAGLIAMAPNVIPIWVVFGSVGFMGLPVDIGMMMTGSIALGISVDHTFHFLVKYQQEYRGGASSLDASRAALVHTGKPLVESTVISSCAMLALCLSSFVPTARFGWLMASLMMISVVGELILLPALLSLRPARKRAAISPKIATPASDLLSGTRFEPAHSAADAPHATGQDSPAPRRPLA